MWSFPGAFDKLRIWWNRQSIINQVPKKLYSCGTQLQSAASQSVDELDIEGPASLCVIFHRWNFTNMLISHSAFFSHAKHFHFFSSSLSFTFFSRMPITPCPLYSGRYACAQLLTTRTVQVRLLCLSHANTMSVVLLLLLVTLVIDGVNGVSIGELVYRGIRRKEGVSEQWPCL